MLQIEVDRGKGEQNALSQVCGVVGGVDGATGLLASTGQGRCGCGNRARIRCRTAGMRVWLLRICALLVRTLRLLRAKLVFWRIVHWRRAVVSRIWGPGGMGLWPRRLWLRSRLLRTRSLRWTRFCTRSSGRLPWRRIPRCGGRWVSRRSTRWLPRWRRTSLMAPQVE